MRCKLLVVIFTLLSFPAFAMIELSERLTLSGFGSTSLTKSDNKTPLIVNRGIDDDLCLDCDTTLGLQLDYFNGAFKASAQLVKRPQDEWSDPELEWGYVSYSVDNVELRAGRLRLPIFLASEYYYVSHAYLYARPPEEVYNSILGLTAYNGASVVWNFELFDEYQLSITPYLGFKDKNDLDITDMIDIDIDIDKVSGINLLFTGDYYRWNFTYFNADYSQTYKFTNFSPSMPYFERHFANENIELYTLGAEYEFGALMLTSEQQISNIRSTWYASAAYRVNKLVPYVVYGENHAKINSNSTYEGKTGSSFALGVRYDIRYNLSLNGEWQRFNSFDGQRGSFVVPPEEQNANIYSLMLNFVF